MREHPTDYLAAQEVRSVLPGPVEVRTQGLETRAYHTREYRYRQTYWQELGVRGLSARGFRSMVTVSSVKPFEVSQHL
jgi:hypothetical protein